MDRYKLCPTCGIKNNPTSFECQSCETDLTSVRVLDEETEKAQQTVTTNIPQAQTVMVRICDCGQKNPSGSRKCSSCGEDISDVTPANDTAINSANEAQKYLLSSIDGEYDYEIKQCVTVGREQEMGEYLSKKLFVSRTHAKLSIVENELYIENLSGTNFTYVNNVKVALGEKVKLTDGDELGLGGFIKNGERQDEAAYFLVRTGLCI